MKIDIQKYIVPLDGLDLAKILNTWTWLVGNDKIIIALSKAGDAFLKDAKANLYFLDTGYGNMKLISQNYLDFTGNNLSMEVIEKLLLPKLVDKLVLHNITLKPGQVYSYTILPILGGKYDETNMYALDIYEHYGVTGDIHHQLKDTPDGTWVELTTK